VQDKKAHRDSTGKVPLILKARTRMSFHPPATSPPRDRTPKYPLKRRLNIKESSLLTHNLRYTKVKLATHMGHVMRMYLMHEGKNQHIKVLNIS
jgi:hypothetical protein